MSLLRPVVSFTRAYVRDGREFMDVLMDGEHCPLVLSKGRSGWTVVYRTEMESPSYRFQTLAEQTLTFEMSLREAKEFARGRALAGPVPSRHIPYILSTLERVMP